MRRLLAECEANDRLRAEDPAAFEAKMRASLPTSKCTLCGESFKGYGHNASPLGTMRAAACAARGAGRQGSGVAIACCVSIAAIFEGNC